MSFGGFERGGAPSQPMAEINVTPLVDVMLVLLVIFIITAPLLSHAIKLDLPVEQAPVSAAATEAVRVSIDADGVIYWDSERVDDAALVDKLNVAARRLPSPEVHLRADKASRYERLASVMAAAQRAGLNRIGFVTEPLPGPRDAASVAKQGNKASSGAIDSTTRPINR